MNTAAKCPDQSALEKLVRGQTASADTSVLEKHMLECERCAKIADQLVSASELTAMLAQVETRAFQNPEAETVDRLIQQARSLKPRTSTAKNSSHEPEQTVVGVRSADAGGETQMAGQTFAGRDPSATSFLRPAQQTDEIGRLGGYRILQVLGSGGMGVVYRAEDPSLKRLVALKVMKPAVAANPEAKARFMKEAEATAAIEHDNIVTIYQVGEDNGIPFIAMQFLKGESLQARLQRVSKLPESECLRIGREVAEGLQAAHSRGLIHRDIKPDNIWLQEGNDRVRIVDFGLVRNNAEDAGLTQSGVVLGTPKYMAPEQARGHDVDHRCDLFSLGSVMYRMVSGRAPFEGSNLTATLIAVAHEDAKPLAEVAPDVSPQLAELMTRLLSKDRDQRPESAAALVQQLRKIEASPSPLPPMASAGDAQQPPKRRTGMAMFAGFAALLLLAVLVIKLRTKDGTVVIELDSAVPVAEVEVDGTSVQFTPDANGRQLTVSVPEGTHELTLKTAEGLSLSTELGEKPVTVAVNATTKIRAWLVAPTDPRSENMGTPHSGAQTASFVDGSSAAALAQRGLRFDGVDDYVHIPTLAFQDAPLTFEAWLTPDAVRKVESSVLLGWKMNAMLAMDMDEGPEALSLYGQVWLPNYDDISNSPAEIPRRKYTPTQHWRSTFVGGKLHHVAIVISSSDFMVCLDGMPSERKPHEGLRTLPNSWAGLHHLSLGAGLTPHKQNPVIDRFFPGTIHAVRISRTARYSTKFIPEKLVADEHTLALYDFEQHSGDVLKDVSGNGHDGRIFGATWIGPDSKSEEMRGLADRPESLMTNRSSRPETEGVHAAESSSRSAKLWPAGPLPIWARETWNAAALKEPDHGMAGVVERPSQFEGIGRWNVDTVHSRGVINVARFSPDGRWLATGSSDGHARIYDSATMKLRQLLPGVGGQHGTVDLSWHPDSQRIALVADTMKVLRIWNIDGQLLREEFVEGDRYSTFVAVAWTNDGQRLICGGANRLEIRDTDGNLLKALVSGQEGPHCDIGNIAVSPKDQRFACWQNDALRIWNSETFELEHEIDLPYQGRSHGGHRIKWSQQDRIALSTNDQLLICSADGKILKEFPSEPICAFAWRPDGVNLSIWRWDPYNLNTESGEVGSQQMVVGGGSGAVPTAMEWSPDGKRLVAASGRLVICNQGLNEFEFDSGSRMFQVAGLDLSPDGRRISTVSAFGDDCVRIWSANGLAQRVMPLTEMVFPGAKVAWSPDGSRIATGAFQASHLQIGSPEASFTNVDGHTMSLAWSPNGALLAAGLSDGHVLITDRDGKMLHSIKTGESGWLNVAWSKHGQLVAHVGRKILRINPDVAEGQVSLLAEVNIDSAPLAPQWSPNGQEVYFHRLQVSVSNDVPEPVREIEYFPTAWSPDASRFVALGSTIFTSLCRPDGSTFMSRSEIASTLENAGAWSPSGETIFVGYDQSLLMARNAVDLHVKWTAVMLPEHKSVSFDVGGAVLDGDRATLEREFAFYAADEAGNVRMLSPVEFELQTGEEILPVPGRYFDSEYRFAVTVGTDWKQAPLDAFTVPGIARAAYSRPGGVSLNIFVQETGAYIDPSYLLAESAKAQEEKLSATVLEKEVRQIAGRDAMLMIVEGPGTGTAISGNGPVKTTQHWIAIPRENDVLVALLTTPSGSFENHQKLFLKAMETLVLNE